MTLQPVLDRESLTSVDVWVSVDFVNTVPKMEWLFANLRGKNDQNIYRLFRNVVQQTHKKGN